MNGRSDYGLDKLAEEMAEIEIIRALNSWYEAGLDDRHLVDILIARNPHIVLEMTTRIAKLQTQTGGRHQTTVGAGQAPTASLK